MSKLQFLGTTTEHHIRINIGKQSYAVAFVDGKSNGYCISEVECEKNNEILYNYRTNCITDDLYKKIDSILNNPKNVKEIQYYIIKLQPQIKRQTI